MSGNEGPSLLRPLSIVREKKGVDGGDSVGDSVGASCRIVGVCFASRRFEWSQKRLMASWRRIGLQEAKAYAPRDLARFDWSPDQRQLMSHERGFGYWTWKPAIVLEELRRLRPGDAVVYADAGVEVLAPLEHCVEEARASPCGVWAYGIGLPNGMWTKRDVFVALGVDKAQYWRASQLASGFLVFIHSPAAFEILEEWQRACSTARLVDDSPSRGDVGELPGFREHRHDQSLLTLILQRRGFWAEAGTLPTNFMGPSGQAVAWAHRASGRAAAIRYWRRRVETRAYQRRYRRAPRSGRG